MTGDPTHKLGNRLFTRLRSLAGRAGHAGNRPNFHHLHSNLPIQLPSRQIDAITVGTRYQARLCPLPQR